MEDIQTPPAADPMAPVVANEPPADQQAALDVADAAFSERAAVLDALHTIEHRSFARASADEPMPVTTLTGN